MTKVYICRTHLWVFSAGVCNKAWMGFLKPWLSSFRKIRYWVSVMIAYSQVPQTPPALLNWWELVQTSLSWPDKSNSNKTLRFWSCVWILQVTSAKAIPLYWQKWELAQRKLVWVLEILVTPREIYIFFYLVSLAKWSLKDLSNVILKWLFI